MATTTIQTPKVTGALNLIKIASKLNYLEEKPTVYKLLPLRGPIIQNSDIVAYAAQAAHVPANDVAIALQALLDGISYFAINGHTVQIPGLGSMKVQFNSKCAKSLEECDADTIKKSRIQFFPTRQVQQLCTLSNINCRVLKDFSSGPEIPAVPEP